MTEADLAYWADANPRPATFTAPGEIEAGVDPCPGLIADSDLGKVCLVAWTLDEIELAHLACGGTLWLSTWGGLPVHRLLVQAP